ncbi:tRNA 2-selenouridine(34) synthase MnmH [Scleromatobacter humisilvae]|uniref:tRNA 2-selenouridine(34) synthase MnmH n=1 Tax=Scleromatobacter humisilvae TaxID=2897159 RepID=A0A9X2C1V4_9BURK|nr:tRNA 2-selenouridine(34) synthase MnmH [Scleromatobacter humisilvae]MCK9688592.1 tRNA 2-selenouridine(34) synthase MnmH [Scleromatobacter humisilvae]
MHPANESPPVDTSSLAPLPFDQYALIIDARSPHEYAEDHVPGAVNLPVVDDAEFAEVGIQYKTDQHAAYLIGAQHSFRNLARHTADLISRYKPSDRFLVYCFRGGKRSALWASNLRLIGFQVDVVPGGWKRYRAWVRESLAALPQRFQYRVLCGPTNCGKTRLLQELAHQGEQVLDLEGLAVHKGSLLGDVPGQPQPTQKTFDSLVLDVLRRFDPARPVWIEAESRKVGRLLVPEELTAAMRRAPTLHLSVPMAERVRLCREDYAHFAADPRAMVARLAPLKPLVGGEELARWQALADAGRVDELFERLMTQHYDPAYLRSTTREFGPGDAASRLELESLQPDALADTARRLIARPTSE